MNKKVLKVFRYIGYGALLVGCVLGFLNLSTIISLDELWVTIALGTCGILVGGLGIVIGLETEPKTTWLIGGGIFFAIISIWLIISFFLV